MTDAASIIQTLVDRMPARVLVERSTGMPYGWALWMKAWTPAPAPVQAREMVAGGLQRPPAAPEREPELGPWRAFLALFRQGWSPAPRDERPARWVSGVGSLVLHVLFVVAMAWMAWLQSLVPPLPPEAGGGGGRVQVGFVGRGDPGTPQQGANEDSTPAPPEPAMPAAATDAPVPQPVAGEPAQVTGERVMPVKVQVHVVTPAPEPPPMPDIPLALRQVPEPVVEPPADEQPVQVDRGRAVPPSTTCCAHHAPEVQVRALPETQVQQREVAVVRAPEVRVPQPRAIDMPMARVPEPQVRLRQVDEPLPEVDAPVAGVQVPQVEARVRGAPEAVVRQRELAMPLPEPAAEPAAPGVAVDGAMSAPSPAGASMPTAGVAESASSAPAPGEATEVVSGGASPTVRTDASSGWDSTLAGDDWGQSNSGELRPGGAPGLFDGQGRIRLPGEGDGGGDSSGRGPGQGPGEGVAERGAPGGENDTWTRERIAQSGTWLRRPPDGYAPTRFDQYWVPNESLLAEWVRKGIKSVAIPIPGTNGKTINCVISLLQLGGGCGLGDPNRNEQPAVARPPPDIPFKPDLQDDNGSAGP